VTAKATRKAPPSAAEQPSIESLQRFTPEQVVELGLTPYRLSTLKKKAQRREIFHHRDGEKITFTREDLRRNAELGAAAPVAISA
jgi:hypothetical protein